MKRAKRGILLKLALLVFFLYASVQIVELRIQINQKNADVAAFTQQNTQLETQNDSLRAEIAKGLTDEQVAKIAHELGLAKPDETVFIGRHG